MSKNLTINGAAYNGISNVTIGSAIFRDADEVITTPTATKAINENGTNIDVLNYSKVNVNVPGVQPTGTLSIETAESGTWNCSGYAQVAVTVVKDSGAPVLSSISATYSGGSVAAGTTLTQLTGISITATYTMAGYTGNIVKSGITSGYTLSGTLTTGQTNTITVSYGGKTTTIQVPVAAEPLVLDKLVVTYDNSTPVEAGTALSALNEVVKAQYTNGTQTGALTEGTDYELSGTLTAGQTNTITVTGKGTYAGLAAVTFSVTVKAAVVSVTGVSISPATKTITAGETFTITATISPSNATNKNVTWTSTAPSIASVTGNGLTATVNALTTGSATIKAVTADGNYEAICAVAVEATVANKHSITYDSTVNGAQTVTFNPMPTEVDDGASTTINMTPAVSFAIPGLYDQTFLPDTANGKYGIDISTATVGSEKITGNSTITIPNQKEDAVVNVVPTTLFWGYGARNTSGTDTIRLYRDTGVNSGGTMAYELKPGKKYIVKTGDVWYNTATSKTYYRIHFLDENFKVVSREGKQYAKDEPLTIPSSGSTSGGTEVVSIPENAKYWCIIGSILKTMVADGSISFDGAEISLEDE